MIAKEMGEAEWSKKKRLAISYLEEKLSTLSTMLSSDSLMRGQTTGVRYYPATHIAKT
jgi:hypothetical protein